MSWLSNLFGSSDKKVEKTFMGGMDYFSNKDYVLAHSSFLKAYKMTKSKKIKLNCLLNASSSAENLNHKKDASQLLIQAAKLKSNLGDKIKDIADVIEKSYNLIVNEADLDEFGDIIAPLMIFKIASQDYSFTNKLYKKISDSDTKSEYNEFAKTLYNSLITDPEEIWKKDDFVLFPQQFPAEFKNYLKLIQSVIRNSAALTSKIKVSSKSVKAGENVTFIANIRNFTPLSITNVFLKSGTKGSVFSSSIDDDKFPKNITSSEETSITFDLEAQLTGNWVIGPLSIDYMINEKKYEYKSDTIQIFVEEGEKSVNLELNYEVIEEDFEFEIKGKIINNGKTSLENIKLQLKIPSGGKVVEGAPEKSIFELRKEEKFEFSNKVRFDAGILGKEYKIKLRATLEGGEIEETEFVISGEMPV